MRRSYNGLSALTKTQLNRNPLSGDLFVFINRRRTQMKVLYFEAGGYCIWCKRLEQGTFAAVHATQRAEQLTWIKLKSLLEGTDIQVIKQRKRYSTPCPN